MPLYEYYCDRHGVFSELTSIEQRRHESACPHCGQYSSRIISAPRLALMSAGNRKAWERNEKSAHEPMLRNKPTCRHGHDCSRHTEKKNHVQFKQAGTRSRPWMLGH